MDHKREATAGAKSGGRTSTPRIFTPSFASLAICNFLGAINFYLLTAVFTEYSLDTYGLTHSVAALSVSVYVIGALVARVLLGGRIDQWGLKRSLIAGYAIIAATTCLYLFALPYPALLATRFIQGIGFGVSSGAGASGAALIVPAERRSEGIGYFSMTQALATGIGPFVAIGLISATSGYGALFAVAAACAVLTVPLSALVKLPDVHKRAAKKDAKSNLTPGSGLDSGQSSGPATGPDAQLSSGPAAGPGAAPAAGPDARLSPEPDSGQGSAPAARPDAQLSSEPAAGPGAAPAAEPDARPAAAKTRRGAGRFLHMKVVPFGLVMLMAYICYAGMISYMTLYAGELGATEAASLYFAVYAATILVSRPPMGRRADRLGENSVVPMTLPALALGLVVLGVAGTLHAGWLLPVSAILTGFGLGSTHSVLQAVVPKVVAPDELGRGNSTYLMMLDLGSGVGPFILGLIVPAVGYAGMYYLLAVWALGALLLYWFAHGRKARK